jgi:hypothetical protein
VEIILPIASIDSIFPTAYSIEDSTTICLKNNVGPLKVRDRYLSLKNTLKVAGLL